MILIDKKTAILQSAAALCIVLAATTAFAAPFTAPMPPQAATEPSADAAKFIGTWHWLIQGKPVITMTLAQSGPGFKGTMTAIQGIQLDKNNNVQSIQPGKGLIPLLNARVEGPVLHFETKDVDDSVQWTMTLKPDGTADVQPSAQGTRAVKPIQAEKAK